MELLLNDGNGSVACTLLLSWLLLAHNHGLVWGWFLLLLEREIPMGMGAMAGMIVQ